MEFELGLLELGLSHEIWVGLGFGLSVPKLDQVPSLVFLGSNSYTFVKLNWDISTNLPICTSNEDGRNFVIKVFGQVMKEMKRIVKSR